jgi:hypothetical protein
MDIARIISKRRHRHKRTREDRVHIDGWGSGIFACRRREWYRGGMETNATSGRRPWEAIEAGLSPIFSDPSVPPFMRDAGKMLAAVTTCATFADLDPARVPGALSVASRLHPELRVPGALFFLSALGRTYLSALGDGGCPYVPAPPDMAWPAWFCAGLQKKPYAFVKVLDSFAWRAAAALLPPRSSAHAGSLGAGSWFPALCAARAVDVSALDVCDFGRAALGAYDRAAVGEAKHERHRRTVGAGIVAALAEDCGEANAPWLAAQSQRDLSTGFEDNLMHEVLSGEVDLSSHQVVRESFFRHAARAAGHGRFSEDGSLCCPPDVFFELGPARSERMLFAARANGEALESCTSSGVPWWLAAAPCPDSRPLPHVPGYPEVLRGKNVEWMGWESGDGIAPVMRELSVPEEHKARLGSPWRFAGAWRAAVPAPNEGREGVERSAFASACAACVRADFLAEWYGRCARIPGRLFAAALADTFVRWAGDGRLFAAGAQEARGYHGAIEDPVGRLPQGWRNGLLREGRNVPNPFTVRSAAAVAAVRLAELIGSDSDVEEWLPSVAGTCYGMRQEAPWDAVLDEGMAELATAEADVTVRERLEAEAAASRGSAFPHLAVTGGGPEAGLAVALGMVGGDVAAAAPIAREACAALGDEGAKFGEWVLTEREHLKAEAAQAPAGADAGAWAVRKMLADAASMKARRRANAAAALVASRSTGASPVAAGGAGRG